MKSGDLVRWTPYKRERPWFDTTLCLLIEYHKWEKVARILYEGKVVSVRAEKTQLAVRGNEEI